MPAFSREERSDRGAYRSAEPVALATFELHPTRAQRLALVAIASLTLLSFVLVARGFPFFVFFLAPLSLTSAALRGVATRRVVVFPSSLVFEGLFRSEVHAAELGVQRDARSITLHGVTTRGRREGRLLHAEMFAREEDYASFVKLIDAFRS